MSRAYKTSKKKRTNYIYYTAEGTKIVITPSEDGVTEADIDLLHSMDDFEVDEQRRYDYRVTAHLDAYHDGENDSANDRNKYLSDESLNPEKHLLEIEDEAEHQELLKRLSEAMEHLTQKEKELFTKKFVDKQTNVAIAAKLVVSETTIRKHLKKLKEKLGKILT
ncbi:sigma-70 family RNA polymerase sigma factor [Alkalihalobacillus trypoxylicola]|uniref:RNA polymerase subunit sigma-24 n=1 Tax=Alkalihalobacillus trypoxylicola TaxID=519424 RepID=A0A162D5N4_9BACI|nr:sigma-70 family RNA polymerase sigma factor [Alkalihalobacillus trypoxylicola]KYG28202.1 RNA polymerase subunit sigma-24 [Alkalihalobacillus trypoxylicola]